MKDKSFWSVCCSYFSQPSSNRMFWEIHSNNPIRQAFVSFFFSPRGLWCTFSPYLLISLKNWVWISNQKNNQFSELPSFRSPHELQKFCSLFVKHWPLQTEKGLYFILFLAVPTNVAETFFFQFIKFNFRQLLICKIIPFCYSFGTSKVQFHISNNEPEG